MKLYAVLCAIALAGCATFHVEPANLPLLAPESNLVANDTGLSGNEDDLFVGLAFSGGGMRAAAFSYGILTEFDRIPIRSKNTTTRLIDHVDFLSGVRRRDHCCLLRTERARRACRFSREVFDARRRGISLKRL